MSRLKTRGPLKIKHVFIISLVIFTLFSLQMFLYVENNLEPALKEISRTYVKQIATLTIADVISKKIGEEMEDGEGIGVNKVEDANGRLSYLSLNHSKQARLLAQVTDRANKQLMELSKEPIRIPLGLALNSNILAQFGPLVPITLVPMGSAKADINIQASQAGINVVVIEVLLTVSADVRIVIPFASDEAIVTTEFVIDSVIINGEIPEVYSTGGGFQFSYPIDTPGSGPRP